MRDRSPRKSGEGVICLLALVAFVFVYASLWVFIFMNGNMRDHAFAEAELWQSRITYYHIDQESEFYSAWQRALTRIGDYEDIGFFAGMEIPRPVPVDATYVTAWHEYDKDAMEALAYSDQELAVYLMENGIALYGQTGASDDQKNWGALLVLTGNVLSHHNASANVVWALTHKDELIPSKDDEGQRLSKAQEVEAARRLIGSLRGGE